MRYISTRGGGQPQKFSGILLEGLASDGGLYVPETFPRVDLGALRDLSYPQLAFEILQLFIDDIDGLEALAKSVLPQVTR